MRLLLTSAGIKNASIHDALVRLLGKPIAEATALVVPTASYAMAGPAGAWRIVSGHARTPLVELGWRSLGVLELTALPSLDRALWEPLVREVDAVLVGGGDPLYLSYWLRESGLAALLPTLHDTVWVGVSAGSTALTPAIGEEFVGWRPPDGDESGLGVVDFSIFPHVDHPELPTNTMAAAEQWAAKLANPAYAIDDATAFAVVDGAVEVVSEGSWRLFD